jgi:hypothetical protein
MFVNCRTVMTSMGRKLYRYLRINGKLVNANKPVKVDTTL